MYQQDCIPRCLFQQLKVDLSRNLYRDNVTQNSEDFYSWVEARVISTHTLATRIALPLPPEAHSTHCGFVQW